MVMGYRTGNIPADAPEWLVRELRSIQEASNSVVDNVTLRTLYAQPKKLYDGLTVLADGTTWNPGGGRGVYTYYGSAWNKLG